MIDELKALKTKRKHNVSALPTLWSGAAFALIHAVIKIPIAQVPRDSCHLSVRYVMHYPTQSCRHFLPIMHYPFYSCTITNSISISNSAAWGIRNRIRIRMFLGLPDPVTDPFVRGMDPDPDLHQNVTDPQHCNSVIFFSTRHSLSTL